MNAYQLRLATIDDLMLFFNWANELGVRQNSISQAPITLENHLQWFSKKIKSSETIFYVLMINKEPVGQLRFDLENNIATINYSIGAKHRGKGFGTLIIEAGIDQLLKDKKEISKIVAKVKPENIPSCRIFEKLNFKEVESEYIQGITLKCYLKKL